MFVYVSITDYRKEKNESNKDSMSHNKKGISFFFLFFYSLFFICHLFRFFL